MTEQHFRSGLKRTSAKHLEFGASNPCCPQKGECFCEMQRGHPPAVSFPQIATKAGQGAWNSIDVSQVGSRSPKTLASYLLSQVHQQKAGLEAQPGLKLAPIWDCQHAIWALLNAPATVLIQLLASGPFCSFSQIKFLGSYHQWGRPGEAPGFLLGQCWLLQSSGDGSSR